MRRAISLENSRLFTLNGRSRARFDRWYTGSAHWTVIGTVRLRCNTEQGMTGDGELPGYRPPAAINQYFNARDVRLVRLYGAERLAQRKSRRQHIIDNENRSRCVELEATTQFSSTT